jgi:hypothetical protein
MELKDLNREELCDVIEQLVAGNSLQDVLSSFVSAEVYTAARTLHSLLCVASHTGADACTFYREDTMVGCWQDTAHRKWLNIVEVILTRHLDKDRQTNIKTLETVLRYATKLENLKGELKQEADEKAVDLLVYFAGFHYLPKSG